MTSRIVVDQIDGSTTAGSIAIQGEGTKTTNLQQGLLKCWHYGSAAGDDPYDSFNLSSLGDTGTGEQTVNFANGFNNNAYVVTASQGTGNQHHIRIMDRTSSSQLIKVYDPDAGAFQDSTLFTQFSGDLA